MIGAEITSNTEPPVGVKGDRTADPVLVDAVGIAQAEVGVTAGDVHGLRVHSVELVQPGTIPKTTSGKIQRRACKRAMLAGHLERVAS